MSVNVLPLVASGIPDGVMIRWVNELDGFDGHRFASREAAPANRPTLTITWN